MGISRSARAGIMLRLAWATVMVVVANTDLRGRVSILLMFRNLRDR